MQAALRPGIGIGSPPPPSRSKQQCVAGLQVASHGLPAWISEILSTTTEGSQAGIPPLPLLDDELELEPASGFDPPPLLLLLLLLLDDELELEPASVFDPPVGGGSDARLSSSFSSPSAPGPGSRSEADSAQAETDEATRTEATRPETMRARATGTPGHGQSP